MSSRFIELAREGAQSIPGILAFRFLPFVAYLGVARGFPLLGRLAGLIAYAALAGLAAQTGGTPFYWLVLAYAYFACAAWVSYEASEVLRSRTGYFVTGLLLFWVLPIFAIRPVQEAFLLIGWDLVLASFSYHADTRARPHRSLRAFLFFLLVNPALVYRHRGSRVAEPALNLAGVRRMLFGIAGVFLSLSVFAPLRALALEGVQGGAARGARALIVVGAFGLVREYAAHSGIASVQIGMMRQLGWTIPERYDYPLFARNPAEFWRRWNTYVGDWAAIYVFQPLALRLKRRLSRRVWSLDLAYAAALVLTFAAVGILHDLFGIASSRTLELPATRWFLFMGCLVAVWEALASPLRGLIARSRFARETERAVFLVSACCAAALWLARANSATGGQRQ